MATTIGTSWTTLGSTSITYDGVTVYFYLEGYRGTQSIENNITVIYTRLRAKIAKYSYMSSYGYYFSATYTNTLSGSGIYTFENRNGSTEKYFNLTSGNKTVTHNTDGTWSSKFTASIKLTGLSKTASISSDVTVPTIPRASKVTVSPSPLILNGTNKFTINTNRASSNFKHTIVVKINNKTVHTINNVEASTTWTPQITLLNEFQYDPSTTIINNNLTGTFLVTTYSGSTQIGSQTSTDFVLSNPGADDFNLSTNSLKVSNTSSNVKVSYTTKNSNFTHILSYKVPGRSETPKYMGNIPNPYTWTPYELLSEFPNASSANVIVYFKTVYNNRILGINQKTLTLIADDKAFSPTVSIINVVEKNAKASAVKDDATTIIRYRSQLEVTSKNDIPTNAGSSLKTVSIKIGNDNKSKDSSGQTDTYTPAVFNNINGDKISATAIDTRGFSTTEDKNYTLIPYISLTLSGSARRLEATSSVVVLTMNGDIFNGSLGNVNNTIEVSYTYKEKGSSTIHTGTTEIIPTVNDNRYYKTINLEESFNYQKQYEITLTISDKLSDVSQTYTVYQGVPIYHWGVHDTNGNHFDVEGDFRIHQHGIPGEAITMTKQSTGLDIGGQVYNVAGFYRILPNGNDSLNYWTNLNDGIYWVNVDVDVTNLPNDFGFVHVINHGNEFSVMFYANGGNKVYHKWGHKDTQGTESYPWKEFQMVDETNWITLNDTAKVYYRKKSGIVTVVINNMNNTTLANDDLLGTLPTGFRPAYPMLQRNAYDNANGRLCVWSDGRVTYGSNVGTANYIRAVISYPV